MVQAILEIVVQQAVLAVVDLVATLHMVELVELEIHHQLLHRKEIVVEMVQIKVVQEQMLALVAVEEVQASNTAGFRSLGARVNAEGTALNAEPGRQVSPMLEYIERWFGALFGRVLIKSERRYEVRGAGMERISRGGGDERRFCTGGCRTSVANASGEEGRESVGRGGGREAVDFSRAGVRVGEVG